MAVPKKRTSKSKKNIRKTNWKQKAVRRSERILSVATSLLPGLLRNELLKIKTGTSVGAKVSKNISSQEVSGAMPDNLNKESAIKEADLSDGPNSNTL